MGKCRYLDSNVWVRSKLTDIPPPTAHTIALWLVSYDSRYIKHFSNKPRSKRQFQLHALNIRIITSSRICSNLCFQVLNYSEKHNFRNSLKPKKIVIFQRFQGFYTLLHILYTLKYHSYIIIHCIIILIFHLRHL